MGGAARVEQLKVTENLASIDGKQRGHSPVCFLLSIQFRGPVCRVMSLTVRVNLLSSVKYFQTYPHRHTQSCLSKRWFYIS